MTDAADISILTVNPALDVGYEVGDELAPDVKNHARHDRFDPGGNGINVGRGLARLGVDARGLCVVAGRIGELVLRLARAQVSRIEGFEVAGETRVNSTIVELATSKQYEVVGRGPTIDEAALATLEDRFLSGCRAGGLAVLTGSVPPGVPDTLYARLANRLREARVRVVVDAGGGLLARALEARPLLVKPNRHELETLAGRSLATLGNVASAARALQRVGPEHVCVSLGADGALLVGPDGVALHGVAPPIATRSTVGAGDSMVAGLVASLARGRSLEEALRLGLACGSGTAARPGTALFRAAEIPALALAARVTKLDHD